MQSRLKISQEDIQQLSHFPPHTFLRFSVKRFQEISLILWSLLPRILKYNIFFFYFFFQKVQFSEEHSVSK